jgi:hypothetical protein
MKKPLRIMTEEARVALADREFERSARKIRARMKACSRALRRDTCVSDEAFNQLCKADPEMQGLAYELAFHKAFRNVIINCSCVPSIGDDGILRWSLPEQLRKPN